MISPEARALCALLLFPLLLAAETRLPRPPETPYIYEYPLPPGPARPIDEYLLRKESVLPAERAPEAASAQARPSAPPAPPPSVAPAAAGTPRPSAAETKAAPSAPAASGPGRVAEAASEPGRLADLEPDLYARLDDSFSLYFSGDTWLFTEAYPDEKGVEYRGRSREAGGVRFSFRTRNLGRYLLAFVLGGSAGGATGETKRVLVEILPEEEFLARIGAVDSDGEQISNAAEARSEEQELPPQDSYSRAWELLLSGEYTAGYALLESPELERDVEKPELAAALFLAGILADSGTDDRQVRVRGSGFSAADRVEFMRHIRIFSRRFTDSLRLNLLHAAVDEYHDLQGADALFFELAELYQQAGKFRDIEAAMRYYSRVVDEYPLSPLWDEAHARRIYLERHFLLVR